LTFIEGDFMPRWIVFDPGTLAQVRRQFPRENLFEHGARNAVEYATDRQETVVAVLAIGRKKEAGVVVFRPAERDQQLSNRVATAAKPKLAETRQPPSEGAARRSPRAQEPPEPQFRAGGLLGLRDEDFYEEEPKPLRKTSWWRRFWPEDD
jgi:hypothetical protein